MPVTVFETALVPKPGKFTFDDMEIEVCHREGGGVDLQKCGKFFQRSRFFSFFQASMMPRFLVAHQPSTKLAGADPRLSAKITCWQTMNRHKRMKYR